MTLNLFKKSETKIQEIINNCVYFYEHNITIDQILFETSYPVLFTAYDDEQTYLFICYSANHNTMCWIATATTYDIIISMLRNEITIRDAFMAYKADKIIITANEKNYINNVEYAILNKDEIDANILPTEGQYMDAEEGEYTNEIQYYQSKKAIQTGLNKNNTYANMKLEKHMIKRANPEYDNQACEAYIKGYDELRLTILSTIRDYESHNNKNCDELITILKKLLAMED